MSIDISGGSCREDTLDDLSVCVCELCMYRCVGVSSHSDFLFICGGQEAPRGVLANEDTHAAAVKTYRALVFNFNLNLNFEFPFLILNLLYATQAVQICIS